MILWLVGVGKCIINAWLALAKDDFRFVEKTSRQVTQLGTMANYGT